MVDSRVLAIVPARGGSKSIPRKNIKPLQGFPLIAYSIAAGLQSKRVSRVIVSTDDEEIAKIARRWGADVPFMRPKELAGDDTLDLPVFQHALTALKEKENYQADFVVHLRPTSPIRPIGLVDMAVKTIIGHTESDSARGVTLAGQNPYKMWKINKKGYLDSLIKVRGLKEAYNAPRQVLPTVYWQTGHIDVIRSSTILKGSMSGKNICPVIIDPRFTVDIDTELDWGVTDWMMSHLKLGIVRPKRFKE